jgi:hypothetical protein
MTILAKRSAVLTHKLLRPGLPLFRAAALCSGSSAFEAYPDYAIIVLTMDVFISWSGERSRVAAEALRGWLPKIINAIKPWLSSEDIDKGARWGTDVASRLEAAKAGIICLTPSNLHSDWILFEAGALSKTLKNTFVCPFLIGLEPSDVKPPLAQFQATRAAKEDVLKLLKTLNSALGDNALPEAHIDEAFDVWWPKLESQLKSLPPEESKAKTHRPDRELLEEILGLVRNQNRVSRRLTSQSNDDDVTGITIKLFHMVTSLDSSIKYFRVIPAANEIEFEFLDSAVNGALPKYKLSVPTGLSLADAVRSARSQLDLLRNSEALNPRLKDH